MSRPERARGDAASVGEKIAGYKKDSGKVAVLVSPWMSNEEAYVLSFALGKLKVGNADVFTGVVDGYPADDLLHTDDHNPNRAGVAAAGVKPGKKDGKDLAAIKEAIDAGDIELLIVWGAHLANDFESVEALHAALGKVAHVVQFTDEVDAVSEVANDLIPIRSWLERDGSWTNCDGHMSRFRKALRPHPAAADGFAALQEVLSGAGLKSPAADLAAARKKLKQAPELQAQQVADGKFSFPENQTLFRHTSGALEV